MLSCPTGPERLNDGSQREPQHEDEDDDESRGQSRSGFVIGSRPPKTLAGGKQNGQGGIRTHDTLAGIPVFETDSFSHSDTCPEKRER